MEKYKEYIIEKVNYLDIKGVATVLNKSVGTIRNSYKSKGFPDHIKKLGRIYFKKEDIENYKELNEIIEVDKIVKKNSD